MPIPQPVDRLEILVLVDNATDSLSTNPGNVTAEWSGLLTGGRMRMVAGENICCAHHGLSLLVTVEGAGRRRTLLFDAGPEGPIFLRNTKVLGVDFASIGAVVLSHGHWDHAGGLVAAAKAIAAARGKGAVPCFMNPGMFVQRGSRRPNGEFFPFESIPSPSRLAEAGVEVVNNPEAQVILEGTMYLSGEIPRVTPYETGLPGHMSRASEAEAWQPDPLLKDERFVSIHIKGKGQFVLSACSHAGLINVLKHARSLFPDVPLYGVMGGLHLSGTTERIIPETVRDLKGFGLKLLAAGHCTGWRALTAMAREFGDELVPSAVGKTYVI
jgi:7,8-dihydropterin-6-yl-methyl-4-(beta-D-ribofuranosyl)aminobenzene 5'-phosphate synthase